MQQSPNWRWNMLICDCGKRMGGPTTFDRWGKLITSAPRCEGCNEYPTHPVEVRLTDWSALDVALRK